MNHNLDKNNDSSDLSDTDKESSNNIQQKKQRGRKKKVILEEDNSNKNLEELKIEQVKKKRGRKKKWEVETTTKIIDNNPISFTTNTNKLNSYIEQNDTYEQTNILFGNLNIKIHSNKDNIQINNIKDNLIKNSTSNKNNKNILSSIDKNICKIDLTNSDFEDSDNEINTINANKNKKVVEKNIKIMKHFKNEFDNGNEILISDNRCYNCHHNFRNKPYFLPINYDEQLKRFKVTGNFCSPNCVKSYGINNNYSGYKLYLIGHMYRQLYGAEYKIKPAPPIQTLKEYGGFLTIEQYRKNFDNDLVYKLKNICSEVICDEIIT